MEEVRQRYRALALQCHPDHHPDDPEAAAQFRQLAEAYETIQQCRSRARAASQNLHRPKFTETEELYEDFFGISGGRSPWRQSPGADFRYDLQISGWPCGTETVIHRWSAPFRQPCRERTGPERRLRHLPSMSGPWPRYGGPGCCASGRSATAVEDRARSLPSL
jgi:molecular chaperone DnaJ